MKRLLAASECSLVHGLGIAGPALVRIKHTQVMQNPLIPLNRHPVDHHHYRTTVACYMSGCYTTKYPRSVSTSTCNPTHRQSRYTDVLLPVQYIDCPREYAAMHFIPPRLSPTLPRRYIRLESLNGNKQVSRKLLNIEKAIK
jgi:hypothetical protein